MIVILAILVIFIIYLVGVFIYTVPDEMKDSSHKPNVVEAQKKAEPPIHITIKLYSKQTTLDGIHYKYHIRKVFLLLNIF